MGVDSHQQLKIDLWNWTCTLIPQNYYELLHIKYPFLILNRNGKLMATRRALSYQIASYRGKPVVIVSITRFLLKRKLWLSNWSWYGVTQRTKLSYVKIIVNKIYKKFIGTLFHFLFYDDERGIELKFSFQIPILVTICPFLFYL